MPQSNTNRPIIDVRTWPGLSITTALQMALSVDEALGISDDFVAMARGITPPLADSITLFLLSNAPAALTELSSQEQVTDLEPEQFLVWVEGLDAAKLSDCASTCHHEESQQRLEEVRSRKSAEWENPREWFLSMASTKQLEQVRRLLEDPEALKQLTVEVLESFWKNHFRAVYVQHTADIVRAVEHLSRGANLTDLPSLLKRLMGRSIECSDEWVSFQGQVLLVPFPFMGPYLLSMMLDDPEPVLVFAFDATRAMGLQSVGKAGPDLAKLKALADETRLNILRFVSESEQFGGDIVTYLGISQPGVSRHLRLLKASGLLAVRQEGTSKFYSLCDAELDALADGIRQMKSDSRDRKKDGTQ
ncbi:ArsR/SmtB family transcription factor [Candidatus Bipolaricaulota bacterium]